MHSQGAADTVTELEWVVLTYSSKDKKEFELIGQLVNMNTQWVTIINAYTQVDGKEFARVPNGGKFLIPVRCVELIQCIGSGTVPPMSVKLEG